MHHLLIHLNVADILKCENSDMTAYQTYYIIEKSRFARWTKRDVPTWFNGWKGRIGITWEEGLKSEDKDLINPSEYSENVTGSNF